MANEARKQLNELINKHDWYAAYSDDFRVMNAAHVNLMKIKHLAEDLGCPFPVGLLMKYALKYSTTHFSERLPGKWYPVTLSDADVAYCASLTREELLGQEDWDAIDSWFTPS